LELVPSEPGLDPEPHRIMAPAPQRFRRKTLSIEY
jgi:hypothetical protein